jgi:hypothetical protein
LCELEIPLGANVMKNNPSRDFSNFHFSDLQGFRPPLEPRHATPFII